MHCYYKHFAQIYWTRVNDNLVSAWGHGDGTSSTDGMSSGTFSAILDAVEYAKRLKSFWAIRRHLSPPVRSRMIFVRARH